MAVFITISLSWKIRVAKLSCAINTKGLREKKRTHSEKGEHFSGQQIQNIWPTDISPLSKNQPTAGLPPWHFLSCPCLDFFNLCFSFCSEQVSTCLPSFLPLLSAFSTLILTPAVLPQNIHWLFPLCKD